MEIINLISHNYVDWRYGKFQPNINYLRSQFDLLKNSIANQQKQEENKKT